MEQTTLSAQTYVQVGAVPSRLPHGRRGDLGMPSGTAAVLKAVLLASAEQVSGEKLRRFGVKTALDLDLLQLAMAFRSDDTGLIGDVFEWTVLLGINAGEGDLPQMVVDALRMLGLGVQTPQAVLVAAEGNRLREYSPELPPTATLATGKRGQPPKVANLLQQATPETWKADIILGEGEKWIAASLKSNPSALPKAFADAKGTIGPPRIGVVPASYPGAAGIVRDPSSGWVIIKVPVDGTYLDLATVILREVIDSFGRHLSVPASPLQPGGGAIGRQLWLWRDRTVAEVVATLDEMSLQTQIAISEVRATNAPGSDATDALIAVNTLALDRRRFPPERSLTSVEDRYMNFTPTT